jgi:general secretion pathway protein A
MSFAEREDPAAPGPGELGGPPDPPAYLAHYDLRAVPFPARAAAGALWLGPARRAPLDELADAARRGSGVLVLTGDAGSGKTSLASALAHLLGDGTALVARAGSFGPEPADLFAAVARACGVAGAPENREDFHAALTPLLDRASAAGRTVLLILDEAQRLGHHLLREVQELSLVGSERGRRLVILLVGQPELDAALGDARHAALARRIAARCALEPLTADEVGDYVRHCLRAAGTRHDIFGADAVREIARLSRGIPARIGALADQALLTGQRRGARVLRRHSVEDSWSSLGGRPFARPAAPRPAPPRSAVPPPPPRAAPRVRGRKRARPAPILRPAPLVVAAVVALFLIAGGSSLDSGQPAGVARAPGPVAPSAPRAPGAARPAAPARPPGVAGPARGADTEPPVRVEAGALTGEPDGQPAGAATAAGPEESGPPPPSPDRH